MPPESLINIAGPGWGPGRCGHCSLASDMLLLKTQRPPDCRGAGHSPQLDTCHVTGEQQGMGRIEEEEEDNFMQKCF